MWVAVYIILWQAGRLIPGVDQMPYFALIGASLIAGAIALFIFLTALAETANMGYKQRTLILNGIACVLIFAITTILSRATYNKFEGLLVINGLALISTASFLGIWLSNEIEKAGHLLPVCIIAAGVDILSVTRGPSSVVIQELMEHAQYIAAGKTHLPPYTSFLILHYPQAGQGLGLMLGVGDLAFFAVLAGAVVKMGLPKINIPLLALWGFIALLLSHIFQTAIPALPFIGLGFVLCNFKRLQLEKKEWLITLGFAAAMIIAGIVLALK